MDYLKQSHNNVIIPVYLAATQIPEVLC